MIRFLQKAMSISPELERGKTKSRTPASADKMQHSGSALASLSNRSSPTQHTSKATICVLSAESKNSRREKRTKKPAQEDKAGAHTSPDGGKDKPEKESARPSSVNSTTPSVSSDHSDGLCSIRSDGVPLPQESEETARPDLAATSSMPLDVQTTVLQEDKSPKPHGTPEGVHTKDGSLTRASPQKVTSPARNVHSPGKMKRIRGQRSVQTKGRSELVKEIEGQSCEFVR